jgi:DNA-binding transcriptional MerR regulator
MNKPSQPGPLKAGALAKLAGVSTHTLRYYESRGVLPRPPRSANGYRMYPAAALQRITVIQQALDAGFSIEELAQVLKTRDTGGAPCRDVLRIANERLAELDRRIESLTTLRARLHRAVAEWARKLESTPPGVRAGLLDSLADTPLTAVRESRRRAFRS